MSVRPVLFSALLALSACGSAATDEPRFGRYDLTLTHPAANASYLSVTPATTKARLPRLGQIRGKRFSHYLRDRTGCVVDPGRAISVIGARRVPAGYMVPIICP